jgi:beta-glucanase (GH16 family)
VKRDFLGSVPAVVTALLLALAAAGPPSAPAAWQLVWNDEFNGTSIDPAKWTFETGNGNNGWGNREREYYTGRTNNAYVANGLLHIVARLESTNGFPYTSARLKTQGLFSHTYGRFEFRARLPQGVGSWPALWLLGANLTSVSWPACGEIDVMENNGSWFNQVQGTLHYSDASNNHLSQTALFTLPTPGDSVTNFHLYAIEWSTNSIKWLVDTNLVQTWTSWSSSTGPYPAPFNAPFFLLMNLAIGGNYLGNPTDSQINAGTSFPIEMQVDYVRVYDQVTLPPNTPMGLRASPGNTSAFLSWDASSSGATGYLVQRSANSGGPYTVIGNSATNSFLDSSIANCATYYYVVAATNSAGPSPDSSEAVASLGSFALAVNSGGGASGQFGADAAFSGGTQASPSSAAIDTSGLLAPAPQAVYQTERYGNFTYTFTGLIPGANYKVRLHFAEFYWTATGQRRFNVSINGTQVLANFDIVAATGAQNKAIIKEFNLPANASGQMVIQYVTVVDNAKSSGIELLLPPPSAPVAANNGPIWAGMTLNLTASSVPGASYSWSGPNGFTSTVQNPSIPNATTNAAGLYAAVALVNGCASAPATTVATVNPPAAVAITLFGGSSILSWPHGTLQSATKLTGAWNDLSTATSPFTNPTLAPQEFFRVKLQ